MRLINVHIFQHNNNIPVNFPNINNVRQYLCMFSHIHVVRVLCSLYNHVFSECENMKYPKYNSPLIQDPQWKPETMDRTELYIYTHTHICTYICTMSFAIHIYL